MKLLWSFACILLLASCTTNVSSEQPLIACVEQSAQLDYQKYLNETPDVQKELWNSFIEEWNETLPDTPVPSDKLEAYRMYYLAELKEEIAYDRGIHEFKITAADCPWIFRTPSLHAVIDAGEKIEFVQAYGGPTSGGMGEFESLCIIADPKSKVYEQMKEKFCSCDGQNTSGAGWQVKCRSGEFETSKDGKKTFAMTVRPRRCADRSYPEVGIPIRLQNNDSFNDTLPSSCFEQQS
jgi:hypothetical protein